MRGDFHVRFCVRPGGKFPGPTRLAGSETAGQRAAAIMSLLATAKANGHEPQAWLTDVLTRLPTTKDRDIDTLLPLRNTP